jgi:hypothetical protein
MTTDLLAPLDRAAHRPLPFERTTVAELWTDEHISAQMLALHLDPEAELAAHGLAMVEHLADTTGAPWVEGSKEMTVVARREGGRREG